MELLDVIADIVVIASSASQSSTVLGGESVVEDLDKTCIWELSIRSKKILQQCFNTFYSCCHFEDIDRHVQDICGKIEKGASWQNAIWIVDELSVNRASRFQELRVD